MMKVALAFTCHRRTLSSLYIVIDQVLPVYSDAEATA